MSTIIHNLLLFSLFRASASPKAETPKKKGKQATKWEMGGTNKDAVSLDYSSLNGSGDATINGSMEEKHGTPSAEEVSLHNLWA